MRMELTSLDRMRIKLESLNTYIGTTYIINIVWINFIFYNNSSFLK